MSRSSTPPRMVRRRTGPVPETRPGPSGSSPPDRERSALTWESRSSPNSRSSTSATRSAPTGSPRLDTSRFANASRKSRSAASSPWCSAVTTRSPGLQRPRGRRLSTGKGSGSSVSTRTPTPPSRSRGMPPATARPTTSHRIRRGPGSNFVRIGRSARLLVGRGDVRLDALPRGCTITSCRRPGNGACRPCSRTPPTRRSRTATRSAFRSRSPSLTRHSPPGPARPNLAVWHRWTSCGRRGGWRRALLVATDIVEVAPVYDPADVTVNNAHRVVLEVLAGLAVRPGAKPTTI